MAFNRFYFLFWHKKRYKQFERPNVHVFKVMLIFIEILNLSLEKCNKA